MFEGIYVAYFTGLQGSSLGMFVFKDGLVVGADAGGGRYDGVYNVRDDNLVHCAIKFTLPPGASTITGVAGTGERLTVDAEVSIPLDFNRLDVHRIDTPLGPINMSIERLRSV